MALNEQDGKHSLALTAGHTACNTGLYPGISSGMFVMHLSELLRTSLSANKLCR